MKVSNYFPVNKSRHPKGHNSQTSNLLQNVKIGYWLEGCRWDLLLSTSTALKSPLCNIFMHKDACNLLALTHFFTDNLITLMLICWIVGFPLLPEGRSARFVLMSQRNCVQPGPESLRLVVQRQVLTGSNMQPAGTSPLIWKAETAVVLTCFIASQLNIRKG